MSMEINFFICVDYLGASGSIWELLGASRSISSALRRDGDSHGWMEAEDNVLPPRLGRDSHPLIIQSAFPIIFLLLLFLLLLLLLLLPPLPPQPPSTPSSPLFHPLY